MTYASVRAIPRLAIRTVSMILLGVWMCSCAVNDRGLVRVRRYENESVFVVTLESWGVHLLTAAGDAGVSFGYGRRTYVFRRVDGPATVSLAALLDRDGGHVKPVACESCPSLGSLGQPIFRAARVVGASVDANASRVGIGLGLRCRAVLSLPADGSEVLLFKYRDGDDLLLRAIIAKEVQGS